MSCVRRDSQRVRPVTTGATSVIGWEVGAHGTSRRHSFHSSAAVPVTPAPVTLTAQTGTADVAFVADHAPDNRFTTAGISPNLNTRA